MSKVFKLGIADSNNKKINEVSSVDVLSNKGVIEYLGNSESVSDKNIIRVLQKFFYEYDSRNMSKKALKITSGNGAELVSKEFLK